MCVRIYVCVCLYIEVGYWWSTNETGAFIAYVY